MRLVERLSLRLFRLAARALPANLRREAGDEMSAAFLGARRGARPGYTLRAVADVLAAGLAERWRRRPPHQLPRRTVMGTLWQDLRFSLRTLMKSPVQSAIAVLTIGLGIGANAAIFSVVNAVLLRPLPFREPERLVELWESRENRWSQASFTHNNFWDMQDQNRTFSGIAAMEYSSANLTGMGYPERLRMSRVSANFFQVLGVDPVVGRTFAAGEDAAGTDARLAVLSNGFWRSRFAGDRGAVGKSFTLDGQGYTIIGVLPRGEPWLRDADVFVPMTRNPAANRGSFELGAFGRMKPGVTLAAAREDLNRIAHRLAELYPQDDEGMGVTLGPSTSWIASDSTRRALWILMGAVGFLLLIACVNLANLFLARATGRARERALRAALGASRGRIVREVLTESLVVSGFGAAFGLAMALGAVQLLKAWNPGGVPRIAEVSINLWVLGFTAFATIVTGLLTGIVPALTVTHGDLVAPLREGERNTGGGRAMRRFRAGLVAVEVAASLALLVGAGLLLRSFREVLSQDRGFVTEGRVIAEVGLPDGYTGERTTQFLSDFFARLAGRREVAAIAAVSRRPMTGVGTGMGFGAADKPGQTNDEVPWASWRIITKDYFKTLGVPIVAGRDFTEQDVIAKPWRAIISKRIADRLWPGQSAVGRQLVMWKGQRESLAEVIGVAGDMRDWGLSEELSLAVYLPYYGAGMSPVTFVLQTSSDVATIRDLLRRTLGELDSSLPLSRVESLSEVVGDSVSSRRFILMLLASFATVALLLALAGVYGVLAYAVSRRTSEIGVRLALGASRANVLRLIVLQGMTPVLLGVAAGIVSAVLLTRLMTGLLFGVGTTDVVTYAGVAGLLGLAGLVSCYVPARQALKVDVVAALRKD